MDFPVHAVIAAHDRFQLEFKYDYEIVPNCRTRYKIVTYIFVPQSLSINRFTYPQSDFYRDLKNYVRLKTPDFTLAELASAPGSPLVRIERILATENWKTLPNVDGRLITNFKFLRATLKNALDLCFAETKAEVERRHDHATLAATFSRNLTQAGAELDDILSRFRSFSAVIRTSNVDARVQRSFALTDESISLVVEEALIQVIDLIDRHRLRGNLTDLTAELLKRVDEESYHRHACHYASVLSPDTDAGEFLFRMSVLKKFTSSVLYLSTTVQREGTTLEQILFSLAAGVSMIFATVVAFYFQQRYGNFTFPFFLALVVGYMFKDRLKESMRGRSTRLLHNFVYDRRTIIHTQDGAHELGYLREKMDFIDERAVPASVYRMRNRRFLADLDNGGQGEEVIRYEKVVVLYKNAFTQVYADAPEISALKDIMRVDIRSFLRKMDEPRQPWLFLDEGKVRSIRLPRVYHVNFLQRYDMPDNNEPAVIERTRTTLTRKGIRRVERMGGNR